MAKYVCAVAETVVWERHYVIEADNLAEAAEKAERGETISEEDIKLQGVINREILAGGPVLID